MTEWEERETCWVSRHEQRTPEWHALRVCRLTASKLGAVCGRSSFPEDKDPQLLARRLCGLDKQSFSPEAIVRMDFGIRNEEPFRQWLEDRLGTKITVPGIAIWKANRIFAGSLDGEYSPNHGVEFKVVKGKTVYQQLRLYAEAVKRGVMNLPPVGAVPFYVWSAHYDQITANGVITGKKTMTYCVAASETDLSPRGGFDHYVEDFPVNHTHWNECLYPKGVAFYQTMITPVMEEFGLRRVDPPQH